MAPSRAAVLPVGRFEKRNIGFGNSMISQDITANLPTTLT